MKATALRWLGGVGVAIALAIAPAAALADSYVTASPSTIAPGSSAVDFTLALTVPGSGTATEIDVYAPAGVTITSAVGGGLSGGTAYWTGSHAGGSTLTVDVIGDVDSGATGSAAWNVQFLGIAGNPTASDTLTYVVPSSSPSGATFDSAVSDINFTPTTAYGLAASIMPLVVVAVLGVFFIFALRDVKKRFRGNK